MSKLKSTTCLLNIRKYTMTKMKEFQNLIRNKKETKRIFSKQCISNPGKHPGGYNNPQWLVRIVTSGSRERRCFQKQEKEPRKENM